MCECLGACVAGVRECHGRAKCDFVSCCQTAVHQPSVKVRVQPDQQQEVSHQDRPRQPCTKLPQQITDLRPSAVTPDWEVAVVSSGWRGEGGGLQKTDFCGGANGPQSDSPPLLLDH